MSSCKHICQPLILIQIFKPMPTQGVLEVSASTLPPRSAVPWRLCVLMEENRAEDVTPESDTI